MFLQIVLLLCKALVSLILLYFAVITWKHFKAMRSLNFYEAQGFTIACGARRFFLGNLVDLVRREEIVKKT